MRTLIYIVGNRPQFVKLAVLYPHMAPYFKQLIIHTGQHYQANMSDVFFEQLHIPPPDFYLNINNLPADVFIGTAATEIAGKLNNYKDALVFVFGDTNTSLAAALAARRGGHQLIHFEAGVRTGDMSMPEEINRVLTDRLATVNFCCTAFNYNNLINEGYSTAIAGNCYITGDLMLDAFNFFKSEYFAGDLPGKYVLCTIHRAANLEEENLKNIITAFNEINRATPIVVPMHPHTANKIAEYKLEPVFKTIPPQGYPQMKYLIQNARVIITDSGGAAREAFFAGKKSIVIMEQPFWPEILDARAAIKCKATTHSIISAFNSIHELEPDFSQNIFGNGNAAENIVHHLRQLYS